MQDYLRKYILQFSLVEVYRKITQSAACRKERKRKGDNQVERADSTSA